MDQLLSDFLKQEKGLRIQIGVAGGQWGAACTVLERRAHSQGAPRERQGFRHQGKTLVRPVVTPFGLLSRATVRLPFQCSSSYSVSFICLPLRKHHRSEDWMSCVLRPFLPFLCFFAEKPDMTSPVHQPVLGMVLATQRSRQWSLPWVTVVAMLVDK